MTKREIISFRSSRTKAELKQKFGNVSRRINELVEREFPDEPKRTWTEILDRPRPKISKKEFERCCMMIE